MKWYCYFSRTRVISKIANIFHFYQWNKSLIKVLNKCGPLDTSQEVYPVTGNLIWLVPLFLCSCSFVCTMFVLTLYAPSPTKWSNTLKQFVGSLTILWGWRSKGQKRTINFIYQNYNSSLRQSSCFKLSNISYQC